MSFVIAWMNLDGIILTEISHREKDNYCMVHTCGLRKKKSQTHRNRVGWWIPEAGRWEKGRGWHTVTSFQL